MAGIRSYKYLEKIIKDVEVEISSRPNYSNLGKKGCLRRMVVLKELLKEEILLQEEVGKIMKIFDKSFINHNNELILIPKINLFISLKNTESEFDLKSKVISYLTRTTVTGNKKDYWRRYTKRKINEFLGTDFNDDDFFLIYSKLGNNSNPALCSKFIFYKYDLNILKEGESE